MRVAFGLIILLLISVPHESFAAVTAAAAQAASQAAVAAGMPQGVADGINWADPKISDAMCTPVIPTCYCGYTMGKNGCESSGNKYLCPCMDPRGVVGICMPAGCKAVSAAGLNGAQSATGSGSMDSLLKAAGDLLGKLMSGGGSGSGSSAATPATTAATTCPNGYYQTSTQTSDPCAYYVPVTTIATSSIDTNALLNALNASSTDLTNLTNTNTNTNTNLNSDLSTTADVTGTFQSPNSQTGTTTPGLSGSIQTTGTGATFIANNVQSNSETSAFFGGEGVAGFIGNLVGGWCTARPWASGFIASIIPPAFFDGLCTKGGFTVGAPATAAAVSSQASVTLTQTPVATQAARPQSTLQQAITPTATLIPPRVDIWAVPSTVPLGARAEIFWNTENVTNCTETSPDGSFTQTSLSGGAATVPLTGPTTFTISCLDAGQNPVTDYVTVSISG